MTARLAALDNWWMSGVARLALVVGVLAGAGCSTTTAVNLDLELAGPLASAPTKLELRVDGDNMTYVKMVDVRGKFLGRHETARYLPGTRSGPLVFTITLFDDGGRVLALGSNEAMVRADHEVDLTVPLMPADATPLDMSMPPDLPGPDMATVDLTPTVPPRQIAPQSGAMTRLLRPTLRWKLPPTSDGAQVQLCQRRDCTQLVGDYEAVGDHLQLLANVAPRTNLFWRLRALRSHLAVSDWSPTWHFRSPPADASAAIDSSYGIPLDLDGDGLDDAAAGWLDDSSGTTPGKVFVFLGRDLLFASHEIDEPAPGSVRDGFGMYRAPAGDVDGDGFGDLLVGAVFAPYDAGNSTNANGPGIAWLYYGAAEGLSRRAPLRIDSPNQKRGPGAPGFFGYGLAGLGDLDLDGYADFAVAAMEDNTVYIYRGGPSGPATAPTWTFTGAAQSGFGNTVIEAGDLDGNGYPDLVISAPFEPINNTLGGRVYVYLNGKDGLPATASLVLSGTSSGNEQFGVALDGAVDLNHDGYADLVVGAPWSGRVYVWFGGPQIATAPAVILGDTGGADHFGASARMLYYDRSGDAQIVVSAPSDGAGKVWYFENITAPAATPVARSVLMTTATAGSDGDHFGCGLFTGEFNGDGNYDLLVGRPLSTARSVIYPFPGSISHGNPIFPAQSDLFQPLPKTGTFGVGNFALLNAS